MKVGYVRTNKKDKNPELQRRDLLAFGCEKIFEEQISSRKEDRPELRAAMRDRETPVDAVCEAVGVSRATLYRYVGPGVTPRGRKRE